MSRNKNGVVHANGHAHDGPPGITLDRVAPRQRCIVSHVAGTDAISQRLMEMGLVAGVEVEVVRLAPLGDPMQISLFGYHLSLRKSEAVRVEVAPCP